MFRPLKLLALSLAVTAGQAGPSAAADLTDAEIRLELIGRQIEWWDEDGWLTGYLFLLPDGSAEITVDRPERSDDTGRWVVRSGLLCTVWGELRQGDEKCYSVEKTTDGRFRTSGGNVFEIDETGV